MIADLLAQERARWEDGAATAEDWLAENEMMADEYIPPEMLLDRDMMEAAREAGRKEERERWKCAIQQLSIPGKRLDPGQSGYNAALRAIWNRVVQNRNTTSVETQKNPRVDPKS